ncbi:hypothetical protein FRB98_000494, partial [Tulasnella sp. 332]
MRSLIFFFTLVAFCEAATGAAVLDPKDDIHNPLRYITSIPLTLVGLAFYLPVTLAMFFNVWSRGGKYMLCMAIGGAFYCAGLALRYPLHSQPDSLGIYIGMYMFVILSPCAFIATTYMLLGRLTREVRMGHYLLIKPTKLTKYFVISDCSTFFIQASGGGLAFLLGLVLQLISFAIFTFLFLFWGFKVRKHAQSVWLRDELVGKPWHKDWRALAATMLVSCAGITVRSLFRVIENAEGFEGPLTTTESYFYCLDSLPLFIAIVGYLPFWPSEFISNNLPRGAGDEEHSSSHEL